MIRTATAALMQYQNCKQKIPDKPGFYLNLNYKLFYLYRN